MRLRTWPLLSRSTLLLTSRTPPRRVFFVLQDVPRSPLRLGTWTCLTCQNLCLRSATPMQRTDLCFSPSLLEPWRCPKGILITDPPQCRIGCGVTVKDILVGGTTPKIFRSKRTLSPQGRNAPRLNSIPVRAAQLHDDSETLPCHVDTSIFSVWCFLTVTTMMYLKLCDIVSWT